MMPAVKVINAVKIEYLRSAFERVSRIYGGVDSYLEKELGVTPEVKDALRTRYLQ